MRRIGCFRLIARLVTLIICAVLTYLLGNSAISGARELGDRLQSQRLHDQQRPAFPGTATLIGQLNATLIYDHTHSPTFTLTPETNVEQPTMGQDTTTPTEASTAINTTKAPVQNPTIIPTSDTANTVVSTVMPTDAVTPTIVALLPTSAPTSTPTFTPTPTFTDTLLPPTHLPTATNSATTTDTPTAVPTRVALVPSDTATNTRAAALPTNTKRPSATVAAPTATPTVPPTNVATNTPVIPPTLTIAPTAAPTATPGDTATLTAVPATPVPTLTMTPVATNKLPIVPARTDCTSKPQPTAVPSPYPRLKAPNNDILNIALLGTDADVDPTDPGFRTDSIVIVSINRTTNTVSMLSIPRDLVVCIPELGMQRINVAYQWGQSVNWKPGGGFGLFQETILYNFGIPVHYYAKISLIGFRKIVDTLNGVDLAVDCPIRNELRFQGNNDQGTPVYTPASMEIGYYHMNGSLALWYARSRKNTSDFDRNRRQQQLLRAIWRTARDQGLIQKAPELWGQLTTIVDTDMQLADVLGLVPLALNLNPDDITTYYMVKGLETQHWSFNNEDVQIPLEPAFSNTLRNFYTPPSKNKIKQEDSTVEILNGTANADWDKVALDVLLSKGFKAQTKGKTDTSAKTIIYDYTGGAKPASLAGLLKALSARADAVVSQPDPNRTTDFRVVLGSNYNSCTAPGFGFTSK